MMSCASSLEDMVFKTKVWKNLALKTYCTEILQRIYEITNKKGTHIVIYM